MDQDDVSAEVIIIATAAHRLITDAIGDLDLESDTKRYQVLELVIGDLLGCILTCGPPASLERIVKHAKDVAAAKPGRHAVH